jgi:seryl-tRNA synthetase
MYTAYPSYVPNASAVAAAASEPLSPTATILGAVAVGLVGLIAVGFVINHFRKGGTVAGLVKEVQSKKEDLKKVASMLPLSEEQKAQLDKAIADPSSLLPPEAQKMVESVKQVKEQLVEALPISKEQKAQLNTVIDSLPQKLVEQKASAPEPVPEPEDKKEVPQREVSIVIDQTQVEAVKAFLASKEVKTD